MKLPFISRRTADDERLELERKINQLETANAYQRKKLADIGTLRSASWDGGALKAMLPAEGILHIYTAIQEAMRMTGGVQIDSSKNRAPLQLPSRRDDLDSDVEFGGPSAAPGARDHISWISAEEYQRRRDEERAKAREDRANQPPPPPYVRIHDLCADTAERYETALRLMLTADEDELRGIAQRALDDCDLVPNAGARAMWHMMLGGGDVETDGGGDQIADAIDRGGWPINPNVRIGFEGDPITDEEADRLRKMRDWTPPRADDEKLH